MGKNYYIILIPFVCLAVNSCAEIDRSSESANSHFTEQISPSIYDILIGTDLVSSDNFFWSEQIWVEKDGNINPKNNNIFLVKKNSYGSREWIVDLGISDEGSGISMTFDNSDNVYITKYKRNGFEGKKGKGNFTLFLVKYNPYGSREWITKLGKSEFKGGARLIVDSVDNIFITGFTGEIEFGHRNTLLVKYDTYGNREWTKILGSTLSDFEWDITVDSRDNIYLTGLSGQNFEKLTNWEDDILLKIFNTDGIQL